MLARVRTSPWLKAWRATSTGRAAARLSARSPSAAATETEVETVIINNFKGNGQANYTFSNGLETFDVNGRLVSSKIEPSSDKKWAECLLPTEFGDFKMRSYPTGEIVMHVGADENSTFKNANEPVLVRIHSECVTSEIFGSVRCDCALQLKQAMQQMHDAGAGVLVYLKQEGRGLGLHNKILAYELQEQGLDTVDANLKLGHEIDYREYSAAGRIFADFELKDVTLMSNNPDKIKFIKDQFPNATATPLHPCPTTVAKFPWMQKYLKTKKERCAHKLEKF